MKNHRSAAAMAGLALALSLPAYGAEEGRVL